MMDVAAAGDVEDAMEGVEAPRLEGVVAPAAVESAATGEGAADQGGAWGARKAKKSRVAEPVGQLSGENTLVAEGPVAGVLPAAPGTPVHQPAPSAASLPGLELASDPAHVGPQGSFHERAAWASTAGSASEAPAAPPQPIGTGDLVVGELEQDGQEAGEAGLEIEYGLEVENHTEEAENRGFMPQLQAPQSEASVVEEENERDSNGNEGDGPASSLSLGQPGPKSDDDEVQVVARGAVTTAMQGAAVASKASLCQRRCLFLHFLVRTATKRPEPPPVGSSSGQAPTA